MRRRLVPVVAACWVVGSLAWIGVWLAYPSSPGGRMPQPLPQASSEGVTVACAEVRLPERRILFAVDTPSPMTPQQIAQLKQGAEVRVAQAGRRPLAHVVAVMPVPASKRVFVISQVEEDLAQDAPLHVTLVLPGVAPFTLQVMP